MVSAGRDVVDPAVLVWWGEVQKSRSGTPIPKPGIGGTYGGYFGVGSRG
jgi:hypothetical protein